MRGMRITPRSIEEIELETMEMKIGIKAKTDGTMEIKIYAKDPHKHKTNTEVYTWDDSKPSIKIDDTEIIYITPEEIKDGL